MADIPDLPVFTVPEDYFEQFPAKLMSEIKEFGRLEDPGEEINRNFAPARRAKPTMPMRCQTAILKKNARIFLNLEQNLSAASVSLKKEVGSAC